MKKKEQTKKAAPVMKRLAREMSAKEIKAVSGGDSLPTGRGTRDPDIYPEY